MSLRYEQYNSLKQTRELLRSLMYSETFVTKSVNELREEAHRCFRHFPPLHESGQPLWSQDEFTEDVPQELPKGSPASRVKKCRR